MRFWPRLLPYLLICLACAAGYPRIVTAQTKGVTGVVRNDNTDAPLSSVHILAVGAGDSVISRNDGHYALQLSTGSHTLRFTHPGYAPLTVVVVVGTDGNAVLDASLTPLPAHLNSVRVSTTQVTHKSDPLPSLAPPRQINPYGGLVWSQSSMRNAPQLDRADLFRLLGTTPITAALSESPSSLHIAGGSADENLVLLDGIPLENAVHAGTITSAIDPEAVDSITLYADHTPARFGGRLSGVIDLHPVSATTLSGTIASTDMAIRAAGRDSALGISGLISVRHSPSQFGELWPLNSKSAFLKHTGWFDGLAHGSMPLAGGTLSALAFQSHDVFHISDPVDPFTVGTGFEWMSSAVGGTWTRPLDTTGNTDLTVRAWQSNTQTHGAWLAYTTYTRLMANALSQSGASAEVHKTGKNLETRSGIITEYFRTAYTVTRYNSSEQTVVVADPSSQFDLPGHLATTAAYADVLWHVSSALDITPGARLTYRKFSGTEGWQLDPRLGVTLFPQRGVQLSGYYSQTSQPLQSLRNEEDVFDGTVGLNLLSTQNDHIPLATSTTFSAAMHATPGSTILFDLGGYWRQLRHIVVDSGSTDSPFFSQPPLTASGFSTGAYATLTRVTPHVVLEGSTRIMISKFPYQPQFAPARSGKLALGLHPDANTELRMSGTIVSGRRIAATNALLATDSSQNANSQGRNSSGSSAVSSAIGYPGLVKLPTYLSFNIGASRNIPFPSFRHRDHGEIRLFVAVDNVFNRANVIGFTLNSPILYRSRSWITGLDWRR